VLVETDDATVLLDVGPDIQEQLDAVGVRSADGVFLTHAHGDHSAGLSALHQSAKWDADHLDTTDDLKPTPEDFDPGYPIYMTETARENLSDRYGGDPGTRLDVQRITDDETVGVGDVTVEAFPVEHHRPTFDTLGFLLRGPTGTAAYAPDMRRFHEGPPDADVDLLVCEGAAILGQPVHGPRDELRDAIEAADADRVVLVNVNEHVQRKHTDELRSIATDFGYELGTDFETYEV
jgi:phosphoribosyl 1,2-cyclic phosphodiesterase